LIARPAPPPRPLFERHGFKVLAYQAVETNGQTLGNYRMEKLL